MFKTHEKIIVILIYIFSIVCIIISSNEILISLDNKDMSSFWMYSFLCACSIILSFYSGYMYGWNLKECENE